MSETVIDLRTPTRGYSTSPSLGSSWEAVTAWRRSGPLVLVQAQSGADKVRARLDLNKKVFIDPTPFESSGPLVDSLVQVIGRRAR